LRFLISLLLLAGLAAAAEPYVGVGAFQPLSSEMHGIYRLMHSDLEDGVNIGRQEYVSVNELVRVIAEVAGKEVHVKHIEGPVGVKARNFLHDRISSIGWESRYSLREGIGRTYPWVKMQVEAARSAEQTP